MSAEPCQRDPGRHKETAKSFLLIHFLSGRAFLSRVFFIDAHNLTETCLLRVAEVYTDSAESGTDDSDEDIITDYLADEVNGNSVDAAGDAKPGDPLIMAAIATEALPESEPDDPVKNSAVNKDAIPTISVTQHSPAASKAFFILGNVFIFLLELLQG